MDTIQILRDLVIIIVSAKLFGLIARRLHAPQVAGEIIAGLIIGPTLFDLVEAGDFLSGMAEIGVILLMFSAGLRNGELCNMERSQIKDGIDSFTVIGKGDKPRVCFIDPVTHRYIDEYLALRDDPYPALFVSEQQKGREKINPGVVQMVVKNAAIKAGLEKNIHPHTLRHSFATDLLRNNTNIVYVKELLGHASIQVTMTYTHVVNEDLHQIHRLKHTIVHA